MSPDAPIIAAFAFDMQGSWLDWPCRGQLRQKVEMALDSIAKYATAFELPEDVQLI